MSQNVFGTVALAIGLILASTTRAAEPPTAEPLDELETINIIGSGETRQVYTLLPESQDVLPPGTSLQKALNILPGVNSQSIDALGANEQSLSISLRGFSTTRLGYALDGIPLGDGAYNNYNGLTISRALISDNLGRADLATGIGGLSLPSTSNLGGAISYASSMPAAQAGARASQTFGSENSRRTYLRLDSGDYGGFSFYLSGAYTTNELFVNQDAYNESTGKQVNAKFVYDFGPGSVTFFADTSRTNQADDFYMSKNSLERLGYDWGGHAPDWNKALSRAYCNTASFDAALCVNTGPDQDADGAFTGGQILRNDDLYYVSLALSPLEAWSFDVKAYHHEDAGTGNNWNSGAFSNAGTPQALPLIIRETLYSINRTGGLASVAWDIGINRLAVGFWYEHNVSSAERYQFTDVTGPKAIDHFFREQPQGGTFAQESTWNTRQAYVQDTLHLLDDRLTIDAGFKSTNAYTRAEQLPGIARTAISPAASGQFAAGSLQAKDSFLPQAGVRFQLAPEHEVFGSYGENIAMFQGGFKLGPLAVSQAVWDSQGGSTLKPERSRSFEGGYRFVIPGLQASITAYHTQFDDRLLQYNPCNSRQPNGPTCGNKFYNVGGVESRGLEFAVQWQVLPWLSWTNTASLIDATYDNDYSQADEVQPTAGKQQVDTPEQMYASALTARFGGAYASLQAKYTGKRYYTYTNDQSFGGFTTVDLGAGYDFGGFGFVQGAKLALNVTNLTDKRYIANLDSSVFAPTDPTGTIYVAHTSPPRQVFGTIALTF